MVGLEIGSYKLVSKIGEGGMGEVWIAEHQLLRRKVAVKLLLKELNSDENVVKRFIQEAKATSQIVHPGIVQILDFGKTASGTYMIMELLEGETLLARARKRGRMPAPEAVAIIRQMAEALAAAHALGVVHRDLKPENVFLVADPAAAGGERVKILDFGIAKMLDPAVSAPHTKTGSILGTPIYMSPEQCVGAPKIDHRADLYALGCVFFHLLCGRPPFDLAGLGELLGAHVYTQPPVPSSIAPSVPPSLDAIVLRLLAKKPDDRYASMGELVTALDAAPLTGGLAPSLDEEAVPGAVPLERSGADAATMIEIPKARMMAPVEPATSTTPTSPSSPPMATTPPPMAVNAPPARREITTLGGAAGESAIPQPETKRGSSLVTMAFAFGLTVTLALGAYFVLGGHGAPADDRAGRLAPSPTPSPMVTLTVVSDPAGAEVYRAGVLLGTTPYRLVQPAAAGDVQLVVKKAGFEDSSIAIGGDRDGNARVTLPSATDGG